MALREAPRSGGPLFPDESEAQSLLARPDSVVWQFGSDPRLYFVMLYPLLLQVADPVVGAGVRDYSDFARRPWDRLFGTLDYVALLIYGGSETPAVGRRLRALHKGFRGTREDGAPYHALDRRAYPWVHATLVEAYVQGHAHFGRPMTPAQRERFLREYVGLGRFVGIREGELPTDWETFRRYIDDSIDRHLTRTASVDTVLNVVRDPRAPVPMPDVLWRAVRMPARRALLLGGLGLMPRRLRDRLGIAWSERDERDFRRLGAASRGLTPVMPERLRVLGPLQLRLRRRAILRGPLGPGV